MAHRMQGILVWAPQKRHRAKSPPPGGPGQIVDRRSHAASRFLTLSTHPSVIFIQFAMAGMERPCSKSRWTTNR